MTLRFWLVALAVLASACIERAAPVGKDADAPTDPAAVDPGQARGQVRAPRTDLASPESKRSSSLISVASVTPEAAQPCEHLCGRVGDCLHETGRRADLSTRLELECLDACVHSPVEAPAREQFLACEATTDCAALTGCAEGRWTELLAARVRPEIEGIIDTAPTCELACEWLISCVSTLSPPGSRPRDSYTDTQIRGCVDVCEHDSVMFTEYTEIYECIVESCADPHGCFDRH